MAGQLPSVKAVTALFNDSISQRDSGVNWDWGESGCLVRSGPSAGREAGSRSSLDGTHEDMNARCSRWLLAWTVIFNVWVILPAVCPAQEIPLVQTSSQVEDSEPYRISAKLVGEEAAVRAHLIIAVELPAESYLYSLTQPGDLATRVEISLGKDGKIAGVLRPVTTAKVTEQDPFLGGRSEKHFGTVQFILPIERISERPFEQWQVAVRINGQVCSEAGSCQLIRNEIVKASFSVPDPQTQNLLRLAERSEQSLVR